eukprot:c15786_g1_i1.p2 GENE.c15786_g1_i1~~c15786_g1_i1.p2  ORF type:complete len:470 (+),score=124.58 c15786_g1_i1:121-1410(+)
MYDDDRVASMVALMDYLLSIGRNEAYIDYAFELVAIHKGGAQAQNPKSPAEAGCALLAVADLLDYSDRPVRESLLFPAQSSRDRKVALLEEAVTMLTMGKVWERALSVADELLKQYKAEFAYDKASALLAKTAKLYSDIATVERFETGFYRIGYYGLNFPDSIRNKEFIYRGAELEQMSTVQNRIRARFPTANFLAGKVDESELFNQEGCHIKVAKVDPIVDAESLPKSPLASAALPTFQRKFFQTAHVRRFVASRPLKKAGVEKDKDNEFATLWLLETTLETVTTMPTYQRRLEVVSRVDVEVSPIVGAHKSLVQKNDEIVQFLQKYSQPTDNPSPFTMLLNGCILALVNGGVLMYAKAFFGAEYLSANPSHAPIVKAIKDELRRQNALLSEGLVLHDRIVQSEMRALHTTLVDYHTTASKGLEDSLR